MQQQIQINDLNTQQGAMKMLRKQIQWKRTNKLRNKSVPKIMCLRIKTFSRNVLVIFVHTSLHD